MQAISYKEALSRTKYFFSVTGSSALDMKQNKDAELKFSLWRRLKTNHEYRRKFQLTCAVCCSYVTLVRSLSLSLSSLSLSLSLLACDIGKISLTLSLSLSLLACDIGKISLSLSLSLSLCSYVTSVRSLSLSLSLSLCSHVT